MMRRMLNCRGLSFGFACVAVGAGLAPMTPAATWRTAGDGVWSNTTFPGWNGPYPASNTSTAIFNLDITADATITIDVPDAMVRQLSLTDATNPSHNWIIASSDPTNNKLTIAREGTSSVSSMTGSNVISAPVVLGGSGSPQFTVLGTRLTISGDISEVDGAHAIGIAAGSTGILELSGNNSYSNFTNVAFGTVLMNGTHAGSHNWIVGAGATLGGTTTDITLASGRNISFNTADGVRSNFRPGDGGVGKFVVNTTAGNGGVNLSGGDYHWEIGSLTDAGSGGNTGAGANFDQLVLNGGTDANTTLMLDGISRLTISFAGIGDPNSGDSFWDQAHLWKAIDVTGTAGTVGVFTEIANAVWDDGRRFSSFVGDGTNGDLGDVYVAYVPEPGTLSILAVAGMGLIARRRVKR